MKKLFTALLVAALMLTVMSPLTSVAHAAGVGTAEYTESRYTDIQNSTAYADIRYLERLGALEGLAGWKEGRFYPENEISQSEVIFVLGRLVPKVVILNDEPAKVATQIWTMKTLAGVAQQGFGKSFKYIELVGVNMTRESFCEAVVNWMVMLDIAPMTTQDEPVVTRRFSDVAETHYAYQAVSWAAEKGITNGTPDGRFMPDQLCKIEDTVVMVWRAYGQPTADYTYYWPEASDYAKSALDWAVCNGYVAVDVSPKKACTRAEAVQILWLVSGAQKDARWTTPFRDVPASNLAVAWAYNRQITAGVSRDQFSPETTLTRAQIATLLYRLLGTR